MRLIGVVSDPALLKTLSEHVVVATAVGGKPPTSTKPGKPHSDNRSRSRTGACAVEIGVEKIADV